ncbi:MAG: 2-oxo acid dehydrogenase subunit E2 [Micropruina sp.]|nr:2-oxo acid dehydrogenase subunit E2 [Micropruina sp.]
MREYPQLNGFWAGEGTRPNAHVGIALAVDTPTGLVAPVLLDPDKMSMTSLDAAIKTIAGNAKAGTIDPDSLSGGTGTLSNLGSLGVDRFNAMLTPPQATALSLGTVGTRAVFDADCAIRAQTV